MCESREFDDTGKKIGTLYDTCALFLIVHNEILSSYTILISNEILVYLN